MSKLQKQQGFFIDAELVKKALPYLAILLTNGGSLYGGSVYKENELQESVKSVITIVSEQYQKNLDAEKDNLRKEYDRRMKICKETKGKICKTGD
jgi:hypothetical protein